MSAPRALAEPELSRRRLRSIRLPAAGGTYKIVAPDVRADDHGTRPYWAQVWPASIALFRSLVRGPALEDRHAVDLGCGLGLAGLGACLLVMLYDIHPAIGLTFGPITFMVCVLGGLGNMFGGFIAAFIFAEFIALAVICIEVRVHLPDERHQKHI